MKSSMLKGIFFDFSGTLDNKYGKDIINFLKNKIEIVIVTNDTSHIENIYDIPIVNPIIATKYITNVVNIIDYVPYYFKLDEYQANYLYPDKIDRIICTGQYENTNENFLLPYIPSIFRKIKQVKKIDTMFKPDETIFHVARLHLSQYYTWNDILMVGDNYNNDIKGAIRLGMKTLLVKNNHNILLNKINDMLKL